GALGQATANLARALGMHVLLAERKGQVECRDGYTSFEQVLAQSDVLSLHCPLTDETRNIISEAELAQMNPNALLINTGRGGLVDEQALVDALKRRQIAGAGVDVFSAEPADMDNPL
ncbi:NAD(P)-dependent oxidoreductase, partial [Klebsiella pneumoniae]